jgi:hypothetical protein
MLILVLDIIQHVGKIIMEIFGFMVVILQDILVVAHGVFDGTNCTIFNCNQCGCNEGFYDAQCEFICTIPKKCFML